MSNHLISQVYKRQVGNIARNAVLVLLADKASDDGSGIWASKQRMAEEIGASKQTVIVTIKSLIADGLLTEVGQRKSPNGYTVEYAINVRALKALPLVKCHVEDQSENLTGQAASPVKKADSTGQAALPDQSEDLTQTLLNPPKPPEENTAGAVSEPAEFELVGELDEPQAEALKPEHVMDEFNRMAGAMGLKQVRDLTPARRELLRCRIAQYPLADFLMVFDKCEASPFLRGDKGRTPLKFDWLFKRANFQKVLEGNYDD